MCVSDYDYIYSMRVLKHTILSTTIYFVFIYSVHMREREREELIAQSSENRWTGRRTIIITIDRIHFFFTVFQQFYILVTICSVWYKPPILHTRKNQIKQGWGITVLFECPESVY